jgi:uncharacterized membrane protein
MTQQQAAIWSATLTPNRSLGRRGFLLLMTVVVTLNAAVGLYFYVQGAWPIIGFMGLDVALLWWAFSRSYADARIAERLEITAHELVLRRRDVTKRETEQRFVRRWVRVELDEDSERELVGSLYLRFKGERTEIGNFLSPAERKTLAGALRSALA